MKCFKLVRDFLTGRRYALYFSGHGSDFMRDPKRMTERRALAEADRWEGDACTIGGRSMVKNIFTDEIIYSKRLQGCKFSRVVRG